MNPFASQDRVSTSHKSREETERELQLRETQLSSLLNITQAINENVSSQGLFDMYRYFLSSDMDVSKMALFTKEDEEWKSVISFNVDFSLDQPELIDNMLQYKQQHYITQNDTRLLQEFNLIIPVFHKNSAIAYTLIGDWVGPHDHESNHICYGRNKFQLALMVVRPYPVTNKCVCDGAIFVKDWNKEVKLLKNRDILLGNIMLLFVLQHIFNEVRPVGGKVYIK